MILRDRTNPAQAVQLPKDLLWEDEFQWSKVARNSYYTLTGALVIESSVKQVGRPITLRPPDDQMGWILRSDLLTLLSWTEDPLKEMQLVLEYPGDTRVINCIWRPGDDQPIIAKPVRQWSENQSGDHWLATFKLTEIE